MKEKTIIALEMKKEIKIGLFAILIIAGTYFTVNYLKGNDIFNKSNDYYTVYESVDGLSASSPVLIKGLKVGSVKSIKFDHDSDAFIVKLALKSDYMIGKNSTVELYSADLMGSKALRIINREGSVHAQSGDTLTSSVAPDMISLLTNEIIPIKDKISVLIDNLNTTVSSINMVLDEKTGKDIKASLSSLRNTLAEVNGIAESIGESTPELRKAISDLSQFSENVNREGSIILSDLSDVTGQLGRADLEGTVNELKKLAEKLQDENGSLGRLMKDDSLYVDVNRLINDIDSLVVKIKENPRKNLKISVF